jgi:Ca2+-transporting ATPase
MQPIDVDAVSGLSEQEAMDRLKRDGFNELPRQEKHSTFALIAGVVREPMFILLVAAGLVYFALGDLEEAIMLSSFVVIIIAITLYQEQKTEKALDALRNLSSPRALVIRDRKQKRIPGREVVCGDTLLLSEGDRVPADGVLVAANNVSVDESLLTGESVPVRKTAYKNKPDAHHIGGDDQPFVYSGTLIVRGQGLAEVRATGINTEMGKIGKVLKSVVRDTTRLKKEISFLVQSIATIGLVLCAIIVIVYGLTRYNWIEGLLAGITLAMAILPEEFPVVLTVFLALGAWRMSRKNVLTRQVPAIETLGSATVLCVDKTGTLTRNKMSVRKFYCDGQMSDHEPEGSNCVTDRCHELAEYAILACKKDPFDPMEKALLELSAGEFGNTEHIHKNWHLVYEYPLSEELLAMSNVWQSPDGTDYIIAAKGAPEAIADLCHFDTLQMQDIMRPINLMASEGLRVLGVARASFRETGLPLGQHDFGFAFIGLVGFADPVRPGVNDAIKDCYSAGIRVIMITGDYPLTAQNIARQIGLDSPIRCITGNELETMSDETLRARIRDVTIFARVVPEQKLRIVQSLKDNGDVVAMTGDGVNDAPALKAADIGIAMGGRGTDVARESASLVLLDDDFSSIVAAVRMGRRVFDNLKKAIAYIFSIHVPIAGMSLLPVLFGWPLILLPVHIVFLELIIDPACSVAFEAEPGESDVMKRPPKKPEKGLVNRNLIFISLAQGFVILAIVICVYLFSTSAGTSEAEARALTFTSIVISNLGLILTNRSWSDTVIGTLRIPNKALWYVVFLTLFFLCLVLYVPQLNDLFRFAPLAPAELLISTVAGVLGVFWFEMFKLWKKRRIE